MIKKINRKGNIMRYDSSLFKIEGTTLISYIGNEEHVIIPDGVTEIVFIQHGIKSVYIPRTVTKISSNMSWSEKLEKIVVSDENPYFTSVEGVLFNWDKSKLICYPAAREGNQYTITSNVTHIAQYAFTNVKFPIDITLENGITEIGDNAFNGCRGLRSISIPNSVIRIGNGAFSRCCHLLDVKIPDSVVSIGDDCFSFCERLRDIVIPESVVTLAPNSYIKTEEQEDFSAFNDVIERGVLGVFAFCKNLTSVVIGAKVTYLPYGIFQSCGRLLTVRLSDTIKSFCDCAFDDCMSLEYLNIPDGVNLSYECVFGILKSEIPVIRKIREEIRDKLIVDLKTYNRNKKTESITVSFDVEDNKCLGVNGIYVAHIDRKNAYNYDIFIVDDFNYPIMIVCNGYINNAEICVTPRLCLDRRYRIKEINKGVKHSNYKVVREINKINDAQKSGSEKLKNIIELFVDGIAYTSIEKLYEIRNQRFEDD